MLVFISIFGSPRKSWQNLDAKQSNRKLTEHGIINTSELERNYNIVRETVKKTPTEIQQSSAGNM